MTSDSPSTLYDKIWQRHHVDEIPGHPAVIYIDLHLVQEGTFLQAFEMMRRRHLPVRRRELTVSVTDHFVPTVAAARFGAVEEMPYVVGSLMEAAEEFGLTIFGPNHRDQGIVHVIGPELGLTLPGMTVVCADSHTSTHGALGALAFGIGTTEVGHVLASQCLLQRKQKALRATITQHLQPAVTSKDLALALMSRFGVEFGRGHAIEFAGAAVEGMSIEARMSLCNMAIEMGSRTGLVAPDGRTAEYIAGRQFAPEGTAWEQATEEWRFLKSDEDALFDRELVFDSSEVSPMVTYGTNPGMAIPVTETVPRPDQSSSQTERSAIEAALDYMGLRPGQPIQDIRINTVFIGSCTNSRIEDLRAAASVIRGRTVAERTHLKVVPGSQAVKRQAEAEDLDKVFLDAGASWGEPSCSLCVAVNGDVALPGEYVASTSNRNFQGRQGPGARTILMSPLTAAATAVAGVIADPRDYLPVNDTSGVG